MHDSRTDQNLKDKGLSHAEVLERLRAFGPNQLPEKKGRTAIAIYLSQFRNPLIYIITAAAIVAFALEEYTDALIIAVVIFVDTIVGFFQEYRPKEPSLPSDVY